MNAPSPRMAMFRKELRDGLPLGVLMLLSTTFVLWLVVKNINPYSFFGSGMITDAANATDMLAAAIGLLIGIVYTFRDSRGDRFAFLTHRPLDRTGVFAATIGAAMVWYVVALAVPIAVMLAWASAPGHLAAPFDPLMARPFIVDVVAGAVWLLAGVTCVMRRARWYGTRVLPAIAAIALSAVSSNPLTFGPALALALCALLLSVATAWGAFASGGDDEAQPAIGRAALITSALVAYGGIAALIISTVLILSSQSAERRRRPTVRLTATGALVRVVPRPDGRAESVEDARGRRMSELDDSVARARALPKMRTASGFIELAHITDGVARYQGYRESFDLVVPFRHPRYGAWSYVKREGLFEQYDPITRRRIVWIGPGGPATDSGGAPPANRFRGTPLYRNDEISVTTPIGLGGAVMDDERSLADPIAFRDAVYVIEDGVPATVRVLFTAPAGETILGVGRGSYDRPARTVTEAEAKSVGFGIVATNAFVYVLVNDAVRTKLPTTGMALETRPTISVVRQLDFAGVPTLVNVMTNGASHGFLFDTLGVLRDTIASPYDATLLFEAQSWVSPFSAFLTPPILDFASHTVSDQFDPTAMTEYRQLVGGGGPRPAWVVMIALWSAALAFFFARRRLYRGRRLTAWILVAAAFGPVGILALWSTSDSPVRERCPACGRTRLVTREHCEHCAAPFPPPALDGTEILLPTVM